MSIADEIFNILLNSTPTNKELADQIYGELGLGWVATGNALHATRWHVSNARKKYKVNIIADHNGRYHMSKNSYTFDSTKTVKEKICGKLGRPRINF